MASAMACVCSLQWSSISTYLVKTIAGLDQTAESTGYQHLRLSPGAMPGAEQRGGMSAASASLALARGDASIAWQWVGGTHCVTAADGSEMQLDCGANGGVIESVMFASYGTPTGQCGAFVADTGCDHPKAVASMEAACVGKTNCSITVSPAAFGSSDSEACAPPAHAQRVHAQVVCSAPRAQLLTSVSVPITSTGSLELPVATHHSKLMLRSSTDDDDANAGALLWKRGSGSVAGGDLPAGVNSVVHAEEAGVIAVAVGSGSYDLVLA
jgi:hypothetical protein|eukprot:COSAG06_NODE_565_length_14231_cov_9.880979_5_plen_269_part_00